MTAAARKPRVFIVSSSESKPLSEVIHGYLKRQADVTPWYLPSIWKPGSFILQVLLEHAPRYDFAVIVLGPDDKVISRGKKSYAPRDNVIFEAGMFMSQLGHLRTFILAPRGHDLKILSDFAGLIPLSYEQPDKTSGWKGALKSVAQTLSGEIETQKTREPIVAARPGPANFGDAHSKVVALLSRSRESKKRIEVCNIALDMELTWGLVILDHVVNHAWRGGLHWKSLMIDHQANVIRGKNTGRISLDTARNQEQEIVKYCKAHRADLEKRKNITFECRAYSSPPIMHGFAIGTELYVGFCWTDEEKVACAPYISFTTAGDDIRVDHETGGYYTALFNGAFSQLWKHARRIWPE